MHNTIVFDIETIPDLEQGRRLYNLNGLNDAETYTAMTLMRRQENNSEFLPLYLHKIVCISLAYRYEDKLKIWSLGGENQSEPDIIERFFEGINKYIPALVTWNGSGFDLPVLHYRMLFHGIKAPRYWEVGDGDSTFRWNNYLNRYHYRHLDLMDILAAYQSRANAPLDAIATILGLPGKMGMHGGQVWDYYSQNKLKQICDYCETDVLNTYLVYLRFEWIRGNLNSIEYHQECELIKTYLIESNQEHFNEFLTQWDYEKFKNL
jgi:predicted PolB exonuclease-like 3'-5' exonuclease